jgi:hypothetical protein
MLTVPVSIERYIVVPQNVVMFVKHESSLYKGCVFVEYLLATSHDCGLFEDIPQYSSALSEIGKPI